MLRSFKTQRMTRSSSLRALLSLSLLAALTTTAAARDTAVRRIDGEPRISPDSLTVSEIQRADKQHVTGVFQVCVDSKGDVADIGVVKSTTYRAYDAKIQRQIRTWKYQPVLLDGKAAPFCTMVTLIYQQKR